MVLFNSLLIERAGGLVMERVGGLVEGGAVLFINSLLMGGLVD